MGKTQIGELFFKERSLRLPSPWPERLKLVISEKHLRLLITVLIILFLLVLGSALFLQLLQSRSSHLSEQNRLSALYGKITAQSIAIGLANSRTTNQTAPLINSETLRGIVPAEGLAEALIFAIAD